MDQNNIQEFEIQKQASMNQMLLAAEVIERYIPNAQKLSQLINKLNSCKNMKERRKTTSQINDYLTKLTAQAQKVIFQDDVENIIKNGKHSTRFLTMDNKEKREISKKISDDAIRAMRDFLTAYSNASYNIEVKSEFAAKVGKEPTPTEKSIHDLPANQKSAEKILNGVEHTLPYGLSSKEIESIRNQYPDLTYTDDHLEAISDMKVINNKLNNKNDITLDDVANLAVIISKNIPDILLDNLDNNPKNYEINKFINLNNSLELYQTAYNKFMQAYNKANPRKKEELKKCFSSSADYNHTFNKNLSVENLITPKELKDNINKVITTNMTKGFNRNYYEHDAQEITIKNIDHATQYMEPNEIVSIYKDMQAKLEKIYESYKKYDTAEPNYEYIVNQYYPECFQTLQENFITVLSFRLANTPDKNLSSEEICQKYFNEKYLGSSQKTVESQNTDDMIQTDMNSNIENIKKEANARFYGMSKLEVAISKINGTWKRFTELMNKELSEEEAQELDGMFRK